MQRLLTTDSRNRVKLDPEMKQIPEFMELYTRDKDRKKRTAYGELLYVYHLCDFKSFCEIYPEGEREQQARHAAGLPEDWEPDDAVKAAVEFYNDVNDSIRSLRLVRSAYNAIDSLEDYFNNVDFTETEKNGKLKYPVKDVMTAMEKVDKMIENLGNLERRVRRDLKGNTSARGNAEKNIFEDPDEQLEEVQ